MRSGQHPGQHAGAPCPHHGGPGGSSASGRSSGWASLSRGRAGPHGAPAAGSSCRNEHAVRPPQRPTRHPSSAPKPSGAPVRTQYPSKWCSGGPQRVPRAPSPTPALHPHAAHSEGPGQRQRLMLFVVLALQLPDQWDLCVLRCLSVLAPTAVSWCTSVTCPCP